MENSKDANKNKISEDDLMKEYDKNLSVGFENIEREIKKKVDEVEMQSKLIIILNDINKEGRRKFIDALKNKSKK